jgi:hypothetical protein
MGWPHFVLSFRSGAEESASSFASAVVVAIAVILTLSVVEWGRIPTNSTHPAARTIPSTIF